ncbi:MAG TPA: flavin-dependent dehydrogenase, partial [Cyanothece sp. UBA12306]|nr:flavin-dependent dehydrogenase [Cyanothece sp. UBA12306]
ETELSIFLWSVQRTTYLKVFRWGNKPFPSEKNLCHQLVNNIQQQFPPQYPQLPDLDLSQNSIFEALE